MPSCRVNAKLRRKFARFLPQPVWNHDAHGNFAYAFDGAGAAA